MEKINLLHELKIRDLKEKIDWDKFSFDNVKFPPLYKVFQETYDVESYNGEGSFSFYVKSENRGFNFGTYIFEFGDVDVGLGNFIHPKDVKRIMKEALNEENDVLILNNKLIPIGITNFNEFIVVGYGEKNLDKIYIQDHSEQTIIELTENIFEFSRRVNLIPKKRSFLNNFNELYKKWGEDYWRKYE